MRPTGLILAAPRSGSGKTTVTLGLAAALRRRGHAVAVAKSGPDYIDPAFHAAATGRPTLNLDSWAMGPDQLDGQLAEAADGAEILLIEASMGLFDGAGPAGRAGRAADLAARFGLPVVLVLDVSGQSQTAAAGARGFIGFEPGVTIAGAILNRLGSAKHEAGIRPAMEAIGLPVLGSLLRAQAITLPERHLGLVQAEETDDLAVRIAALADLAEARFDLDAILAAAKPITAEPGKQPAIRPPGQRIAVARDAAFTFVYPHLLAGWRRAGAEISFFSPLADQAPEEKADACWLPGGYPELHGSALAAARRFKAGLRAFADTRPVHGECGGYMVLGATLTDASGQTHEMVRLLTHATSFAARKMHLGYRRATLLADGALGPAGSRLRGHEFHYATVSDPGSDAAFVQLEDAMGLALGSAGSRLGRVSGSFFHLIAQEE
ncbi:MAG TPA: cobyrinate a,c-diamide synthase [Acidisoma sp.]|uniref:cobyrinate a,c-diamide synthase n=1 Tax=Acidisoma sp. TaxID=1872115 RepID=UPI002BF7BBBE|nr:cobyrinate a,c-diamide synthase [Acidisoma sp.]HTI02208.1 cobyrinate a,c-diamide synthase [Acidisoma sp.]